MKTNVSWTTSDDSRSAGKTVAKKAVLDLEQTKLAFLFNSSNYDQMAVINGSKEELGSAPIIGCTTSNGFFTPEGFMTSSDGFSSMLAIGDKETEATTGACKRLIDPSDSAKFAIREAMSKRSKKLKPNYCFMFCTPGHEAEYERGAFEELGSVPIFGGTAGIGETTSTPKVFTENALLEDGVAVALIFTDKNFENMFNGKYHETIKSGVVTSVDSDRRVIKQINNKDAFKLYANWNNKKVSDYANIENNEEFILNPLGIKSVDGGSIIIKKPIEKISNNFIKLNSDIFVNQAIIKMTMTHREMITSPAIALRNFLIKLRRDGKQVNSLLLFQNSNRIDNLKEDEIDEMYSSIKCEAGKIPFLMPLTYAEFGLTSSGANVNGDLMLSFIAICSN